MDSQEKIGRSEGKLRDNEWGCRGKPYGDPKESMKAKAAQLKTNGANRPLRAAWGELRDFDRMWKQFICRQIKDKRL